MSASSVLSDGVSKDILPWLKLAEDLHTLNLDHELKVPQMCVMGDQSSGKSSVLEALSGIPFPRGSGLVTRCPIRLVMRKAKGSETFSAVAYTTVDPNKKHVDNVIELTSLIQDLMDALCKTSMNFSTESVIVELVSPDACDLTVVDLPGIIRTVTAGQNVTVIEQVNRLIKSYLVDPRTIILAIIPANQDIATVDILERAMGVDPSGERTVGVLTKSDMISPGSEDEVLAVLTNVRKPLKLGYTMLKNRSQKELLEKVTTSDARTIEEAFFKKHDTFKHQDPQLFGISNLAKKLTYLLVARIKQELAPMKIEVDRQLSVLRMEMRSLGPLAATSTLTNNTAAERQKLLVHIVQQYVRHLTDCVRGEYRDRIMVRHTELRLYTSALHHFQGFQVKVFDTAPPFKDEAFVQSIAIQIDQLRGRELPGFLSTQAFYMCMSQYVNQWREPMLALLQDIQDVAQDVTGLLADVLVKQYPGLCVAIRATSSMILNNAFDDVKQKLSAILDRETDPFTMNEFLQQWVNKLRYDRFSEAVDEVFSELKSPANNWSAVKEEVFVEMRQWYRKTHSVSAEANARDMCAIMEAYWNLSAKRFVDNCCMMVDKELLGTLPVNMQSEMYRFVRDDNSLEQFLLEDPQVVHKRHEMEKRRLALTAAASALGMIVTNGSSASAASKDVTAAGAVTAAATTSVSAGGGGFKTITFVIPSIATGLGLAVTEDNAGTPKMQLRVQGFRNTPGQPSAGQQAGLLVDDIIDQINGTHPASTEDMKKILVNCPKNNVNISILRKQPK